MKKTHINKTIKPYLGWLDGIFGHLANEAAQNKVSAGEVARAYLSDPGRRERFRSDLMPEVCERVIRFWKENHKVVESELRAATGLKAHFGGDMGPQKENRPFERVGLYFDTLVVPDPMLRAATTPKVMDKTKDYYVLKYAIAQSQFKEVYLADVVPQIAVLVGEPTLFDSMPAEREVYDMATIDCVAITNELYDQKLESYDEVRSFFSKFSSRQEAAKEIARPELFFLDETAPLDPVSQLEASLNESERNLAATQISEEWLGPLYLLMILYGRMVQSNDILHKANAIGSHPLVQAPVSFHWLNLKIKTTQKLLGEQLNLNPHLELIKTNALLSKQLAWLGNVPLTSLIELRKKGRLGELRKLIDQDLGSLSNIPLTDVERVANEIDYNLSTALEQHHEKIAELNSDLRRELATSVPTLLVSVAAALQPAFATILPAWVAPAAGVVGATKLRDVITAASKYFKERKALGSTPVGILWEAKKEDSKAIE